MVAPNVSILMCFRRNPETRCRSAGCERAVLVVSCVSMDSGPPRLVRPVALVGDSRALRRPPRRPLRVATPATFVMIGFLNMIRLHFFGRRARCTPPNRSSEHSRGRLHAHADVNVLDRPRYQRNKRGPSIAPAKVQSTIVPPYQTATNGNESSVQWNA